MEPDQYQMGSTKVFVKNPESVSVGDPCIPARGARPALQAPLRLGPVALPPWSLCFSIWEVGRVVAPCRMGVRLRPNRKSARQCVAGSECSEKPELAGQAQGPGRRWGNM